MQLLVGADHTKGTFSNDLMMFCQGEGATSRGQSERGWKKKEEKDGGWGRGLNRDRRTVVSVGESALGHKTLPRSN